MKVRRYQIILVIALVIFGVGSFKLYSATGNSNLDNETEEEDIYDELLSEENYIHTLNDFVITASEGDFIIKMTATLHFNDKNTFLKFNGVPEGKEDISESTLDEDELSLMEVAVNDEIGTLMFDISPDMIFDKKKINKYLKNGINEKFSEEEDFIKNLYIENLIIQ